MTDLFRLLPDEVDGLCADLRLPAYRANQILQALYRGNADSIDDLQQLPRESLHALKNQGWTVGSVNERSRVVASDGQTTKLLLETGSGTLIESVLMQYPRPGKHPRSTICVSTQAGCAMGCVFCATGQMGFERNLAAEEIVAQVVHFARLLRRRQEHVTHVVFMGMGEPLANYDETLRAIRLLSSPRAFGLAQRAITVSTVGIVRGIDRLATEGLQVNLAISLHAPEDELRKSLIPTAAPGSVRALVDASQRYRTATGRRVSFEYALIEGVNDSPEIALKLARRLQGTDIHVNLIPLNPTAGEFRRPSRERVRQFRDALSSRGTNCTVRVEKGVEISAACGQLRTESGSLVHPRAKS